LRHHARRQPPKGSSFPFSNIAIRACQRKKPHFSRLNRFSFTFKAPWEYDAAQFPSFVADKTRIARTTAKKE